MVKELTQRPIDSDMDYVSDPSFLLLRAVFDWHFFFSGTLEFGGAYRKMAESSRLD